MKRAIEFGAARTSDEEKLKGAIEAPYYPAKHPTNIQHN